MYFFTSATSSIIIKGFQASFNYRNSERDTNAIKNTTEPERPQDRAMTWPDPQSPPHPLPPLLLLPYPHPLITSFNFLFWNNCVVTGRCTNTTEIPCILHPAPIDVMSCVTTAQYQNQELGLVCVWIMPCHFIIHVHSCNHHCYQDTELCHHHKELPRATLYNHIDLPSSPTPANHQSVSHLFNCHFNNVI